MRSDEYTHLCKKYVTEVGEGAEDGGQHRLVVEGHDGQVVHLEHVGHVADPHPVTVGVRDDHHLVAALQQTLRQLEDVGR